MDHRAPPAAHRGHAVLPRARLRDDALLAHALAQQGLAQGVVDLVGPRVVQVLALQVDLGAAAVGPAQVGEVEVRPRGRRGEG